MQQRSVWSWRGGSVRVSSQEICWYVAHYTREGATVPPPGVSVGRSLSKVRWLKDIVN